MSWFKADDKLHSHMKTITAGTHAMGLWILAGSWVADEMSDGFVPEGIAIRFSKTLLERAKSLEDDREEDRAEHRREIADVREAQTRTDEKLSETLTILSLAIDFIGELYRWGRQGGGEPEPTAPKKLREWLGHLLHPSKED